MSKPTDIRLLEVRAETERHAYRTPIKFGGRVVTDVILLGVTAEVETRDGRRGRGFGSMPMGNVWAWPSPSLPPDATLSAMAELGKRLAARANDYRDAGHPLEITHDLAQDYGAVADEVSVEGSPQESQFCLECHTTGGVAPMGHGIGSDEL